MKRSSWIYVIMFLAILTLSVGISPSFADEIPEDKREQLINTTDTPKYGGTFIIATYGDLPTLNPGISTLTVCDSAWGIMWAPLLTYDLYGTPGPNLAESWEISSDALTYTFHLVKNATFHDGYPITSEDVKFTFENVTIPLHPRGSFKVVDHIEAPDNYTVVFTLKNVLLPFIQYFTVGDGSGILPKHIYGDGQNILTHPRNTQNPVGSGPFKFKEWVAGDHLTFVRYENYWKKGQPYLNKIIIRIIPDEATRAIAFETGEVDYLQYGMSTQATYLRYRNNTDIIATTAGDVANSVEFLFFNLLHPILKTLKVRQAIDYAINKDVIVEKAFLGLGRPGVSIVTSMNTLLYNPNVKKYEYDLAKANLLLDEAGYPRGTDGTRFSLELITYTGSPHKATCEIIQDQLRQVGISVSVKALDTTVAGDLVFTKEQFDMHVKGSPAGTFPVPYISRLLTSDRIPVNVFNSNCMSYNNSQVDAGFAKGGKAKTWAEAKGYFDEVQSIVAEELPLIVLTEWVGQSKLYSKDFVNVVTDGSSMWASHDVTWWVGGSPVSAESVAGTIKHSEDEIARLKGWYYDVTDAVKKLEEAKEALARGELLSAFLLAEAAPGLSTPPYALIGGISIVVIAAAIIGPIYLYRKRKHKT